MEIEGIENLEERDENERKAVEIVINEEIKENRKIKIAPYHAHYDIESIKENDIRYIEVKSWKGIQFQAYFSKSQIDFMEKNKDKYWLYLVYNIEIGKPSILKIKNPIENMLIRNAFRKERYCLYLNKELKKIYSKDISKGIIIGENEIEKKKKEKIIKKIRKEKLEKEKKQLSNFERKVIALVIEEEKKEGRRIKEAIFIEEPYNIISYGNNEEDVRYIEVKAFSHSFPIIFSRRKFNFSKKCGNKYWLYLVINIDKNPKIIKIQNPIEKLEWKKVEARIVGCRYCSYIDLNEIIKGNLK